MKMDSVLSNLEKSTAIKIIYFSKYRTLQFIP